MEKSKLLHLIAEKEPCYVEYQQRKWLVVSYSATSGLFLIKAITNKSLTRSVEASSLKVYISRYTAPVLFQNLYPLYEGKEVLLRHHDEPVNVSGFKILNKKVYCICNTKLIDIQDLNLDLVTDN